MASPHRSHHVGTLAEVTAHPREEEGKVMVLAQLELEPEAGNLLCKVKIMGMVVDKQFNAIDYGSDHIVLQRFLSLTPPPPSGCTSPPSAM